MLLCLILLERLSGFLRVSLKSSDPRSFKKSWVWRKDFLSWTFSPLNGASLVAQMVKSLPEMWETQFRSMNWEDPLEKATHSGTLAWKIPWTEVPGRLQSMGVSKSLMWLSDFSFTFQLVTLGVPPPQSYEDEGREVAQVIEGALHLLSFLCVIPGAWPTLRAGPAHWDS